MTRFFGVQRGDFVQRRESSAVIFHQHENARELAPGLRRIGLQPHRGHELTGRLGKIPLVANHSSIEHAQIVIVGSPGQDLLHDRQGLAGLFILNVSLRERNLVAGRGRGFDRFLIMRDRIRVAAGIEQQRCGAFLSAGVFGELLVNRDGLIGLLFLFVKRGEFEQKRRGNASPTPRLF